MGDDFWATHFNSDSVTFTALASALLSEFPADEINSDDAKLALRFCMGRNPGRECDKEQLATKILFRSFLRRFGSIGVCLRHAVHGVFRDGLPVKWFHPKIGRHNAEVLLCNNPPGSFLVRYSGNNKDALCISHSVVQKEATIRHVLFRLRSDKGYTLDSSCLRLSSFDGSSSSAGMNNSDRGLKSAGMNNSDRGLKIQNSVDSMSASETGMLSCGACTSSGSESADKMWESISDFINEFPDELIHPIESDLSTLFLAEVKQRRRWRDFGAAQELAAHGEAETALEETDKLLECPDDEDVWLRAKAHLLRGDILESLGDETAAIMSYRDVIRVSEERVKQAALSMNGESVLRQYGPILSKSHKCLSSYYLLSHEETTLIKGGQQRIPLGLLHCSLSIAFMLEPKRRREVRRSWSTNESFRSIMDEMGWTPETVAELREKGIRDWHRGDFESSREKFGEAVVQARCLGLDLLETKVLGNCAAVNSMDGHISEAISQYITCLCILRGLSANETYKKTLNFLVITLIHSCMWDIARKYNDELITLAEYKEDVDMLKSRRERLIMAPSQTSEQTEEEVQ